MTASSVERRATRRNRRGVVAKHWREYLAISPFFLLFLAFGLVPLIFAIYLSTQTWDGLGPSVFVGADQWIRLVTSERVWLAFGNTLIIFVFAMVPVVLGSLIGAAMLSQPKLRFRGFYQAAFFLPQVTSVVAVAIVFSSIFSTNFGLMNAVLNTFGLPSVEWLTDPVLIKVVIALMVIWRGFGYFLIIFMAGMSAIDSSVYEAAKMDGAGPVRTLRSITLPLLVPTLVFVTLTAALSGFQIFTEPQVLFNGNGGPQDAGLTLMLLQYQYLGGVGGTSAVTRPDFGFSTVIGWLIFAILVVVAILNRRLSRVGGDR